MSTALPSKLHQLLMQNDKKKIIRILHAVGMMNRGGSETMLMNIFRHIDRDKFEFVFLTHSPDTGAYDNEIKRLGGKIFSIASLGTLGYARYIATLYIGSSMKRDRLTLSTLTSIGKAERSPWLQNLLA
jgi:hypothetical protein